jgi:general secretion pathway protein F/type IV pilus assembly protein PilC
LIFRYVGYDKGGNKVKARVEAHSIDDAKKKLKARGIIYESIKEVKRSFLDDIDFNSSSKIPTDKLSQLTKNLAIYLKSGIPILKVIKLAKSQYEEEPKIYDFLTTLETSIDEGNSFYYALENQKILKLPAFFKQSIKVAEESGTLSEVMFEMARFIAEQDKVKKKVKQAMVYPSFIVVLSVFMVAFMLTTIVPKITSMFTQLNQELPTITQIVIKVGDFLGDYWLYMAIFIMIVSGIVTFFLKTNKFFKYFWDGLLLRLPLFGKIIKTFELARFSYISSVLSKSGVTFIQAIKFASNVLDNSVIKEEFVDSANDVVEGKKFSSSIAKYGKHIDKSFIQAIALAEETSEVPAVMQNMAELYFEENKNKIDLFLSLLEPMLILFVGVTIGVIVVAMLLPIFSMDMVNM